MARIIIGIHGLGNKPPRKVLQRNWKKAICEGLKRRGYPVLPFRFRLVYWADLFHPEPLDPDITDKDSPLYEEEPYALSSLAKTREPGKLREKVLSFINSQLKSLFLNDDMTINFKEITDDVIHKYFNDLEVYYCMSCLSTKARGKLVRDVIQEFLRRVLDRYRGEEIMLIAHSMGSIIAYDVMTQGSSPVDIDTFVTIGSPLGVPVVMSKIATEQKKRPMLRVKPRVPDAIKRKWHNLSDLEDNITINYELRDDFRKNSANIGITDHIVANDYEFEGKGNPHKSFGYLRTAEMADIMYHFLDKSRDTSSNS